MGDVIERKKYLGRRGLYEISLPEDTKLVDDWAFAKCADLKKVCMPRTRLGKGVFEGCEKLEEIRLYDCGSESVGRLLAAVAIRTDAAYLCEPFEAGSSGWFEKWDSWLMRFIESPDEDGYSGQVPCGEEDYGSSDVGAYESGRRREKAELCMLRLLYDDGLEAGFRDKLKDYVREHSAGSGMGDESWKVLLEKHHADQLWMEIFEEAGGVDELNLDLILSSIPDEYVDMKAFFMRKSSGAETDLFSGLTL